MLTTELVFVGPKHCELRSSNIDETALGEHEMLVRNELSIVSMGTELANYSGLARNVFTPGTWNAYPHRPGYGAIGRILAMGANCRSYGSFRRGQRVFSFANHASVSAINLNMRPVVPVCDDDDAARIVLARMAAVSLTAVRRSRQSAPGGVAVVIGLGLVGNFAAQLFRIAGMKVVGIEPLLSRREMAALYGIRSVSDGDTAREVVGQDSGGSGADVVVEASGIPDLVRSGVQLCRNEGEVLLLGSPRGRFEGDAGELLNEVHRRGISIIGCLEWLKPTWDTKWIRWSVESELRYVLGMVRDNILQTNRMVTHVFSPQEGPLAYQKMLQGRDQFGAVLFDWSRES